MVSVSIIIPTYNSESYILTCLESIHSQTFSDYEIIVVDGKSSDNTLNIVKEFSKNSDKLTFISEKDAGIYDAMNKGIKMARGEWVYFIGSDDGLYNEFVLQNVFATPDLNSFDVVYGSVYHKSLECIYDGEFDNVKMCKEGICHQSIFYKKQLFSKFGMYDPEMKIYAHIWLDKIWFTDPAVKWKYIDLIIANYDGTGYSRNNMDMKYWNNAEYLLNKCFRGKVPRKIIYASLLPIPKWNFNIGSLLIALKIAIKGGSLKGMFFWFNHPYQIVRLTVKKYL